MKFQLIVAISLLCLVFCDNDERILSVALNPGCEQQIGTSCDVFTFVHVKAEATNNTLHYLWDFTGIPSLLLAKTDKNSTLEIDWDNFMLGTGNTVKFLPTPEYVFAAVISKIFLFNDVGDKADVNHESVTDIRTIDPHAFAWTRVNLTQLQNQQVMLVMNATVPKSNGSFSIEVRNWEKFFYGYFLMLVQAYANG